MSEQDKAKRIGDLISKINKTTEEKGYVFFDSVDDILKDNTRLRAENEALKDRVVDLESDCANAYDKMKSIELANKEMSRHDHVKFGELMFERDSLRAQLAKAKECLEFYANSPLREQNMIEAVINGGEFVPFGERARQTLEELK